MLCYAIVVTYNGSKWVDACFGSLLNSTVPIKILAVDNGSTDDTLALLRGKYPEVEFVELRENLGFGGANNIGIRLAQKAGSDFVFLLNQDAWVEPDTIEKLIDVVKQFPEFGIVSPVHLNGRGDAFDYGFMNYLCENNKKECLVDFYLKAKDEFNQIYQLDFINAAAWLLPRKTVETVGGFSPIFFQYGEDQDYVNRCHYFDLKVGFSPHAKIYHDRPQYDTDSKRKVLLRTTTLAWLLDPNGDNRFNENIRNLFVSIIKGLLTIRLSQVIYFLGELKFYYMNREIIIDTKIKVRNEGLTFLY